MNLDTISDGFGLLLQPMPLMWLVIGLCLGFLVGVLPGLSTSNTAALLLPFAIGLPTESSLILIVSIYAGAQFGGAVPAILVNVPGEAGAAVTALDGYQFTKRGEPALAIGIARMAAAIGGVVGGVVVLLLLGPLGEFALTFGARELFVVILLGFVVASSLMGESVRKGLMVGLLGLLLATVGGGPTTGQERFTFGVLELYEGISFIPALVGLFAVSEMLILVARHRRNGRPELDVPTLSLGKELRSAIRGARETLRHKKVVGQSNALGVVLGLIPGIGTTIASFVSYSLAKRRSKTPERFGKGTPEGVIAAEACDSSAVGATLVPTLTLGIPGSATMAVVLASLYLQGIQPGPQVLISHGAEAYAAILALIVASILIMPLGVLLASPLAMVTKVPAKYLVPIVLLACFAGAFAVRYSLFDVGVAIMFGLLGLVLRLNGYPVIPLVLGLVLGPLAEENLLRSLELGNNSVGYFFGSTTAVVLWALLVAAAGYLFWQYRRRRSAEPVPDKENEPVGGNA
ncbi:tripartite tricarboxylate transporter permease [Actinophytocola gossypii]|uniref:Tripartite tricarboxylate transporter permease n=1 Tax=Actinophytocola gossypii TaxID=2812003 RepID=A0ABT2J2F5_9PSEU|nr:tripartite tricarboxylate transporter permease [Actinophytocola gossypii]MCT2582042.1 tripartite tricarboxylate transporter permease [Actinophytocola gossypii]